MLISYSFFSLKKSQILFLLLLVFPLSSFGDKYYYCKHNPNNKNPSAFDRTFVIFKTPSGRALKENYEGISFLQTFDEGHRILSLYERKLDYYQKNEVRSFALFQLNIEGDKTMTIAKGYQLPIKMFYSFYQVPYTKEALERINKNPEWLKYFPKKRTKNHLALAFSMQRMKCDSMGYLEFKMKSVLLLAVQLMSI